VSRTRFASAAASAVLCSAARVRAKTTVGAVESEASRLVAAGGVHVVLGGCGRTPGIAAVAEGG
jgi:hypothetical protein